MISNIKEKVLIVIIVILLLFLGSAYYSNFTINKDLSNTLLSLNLLEQKFDKEINDKNEEISYQNQIIISKEQALKNGLLEIEELKRNKKIESKVIFKTETKIDTVYVPFNKDTIGNTLLGSLNYFKYKEKDNWYSFSGSSSDKGITLYDMTINNEYSLLISDRKMGLFKPSVPSVTLTNKNPYTTTIQMNNVKINYNKPFYKKEWFWFVSGFATSQILIKN